MPTVGVDPGKRGAVVVLHDGLVLAVVQTADLLSGGEYAVSAMADWVSANVPPGAIVGIERQWSRPGEGVTSAHTTGYGYGLWTGLLARWRPRQVTSSDWQRLHPPGLAPKAASAAVCRARLPGLALTGPRGGLLDGVADAACIALWMTHV